MYKAKIIQGLKVKYNNVTYEKITEFSISNWDGNERVYFTNKDDENKVTSVTCKFSDIEIIGKLNNE